MTDDWYSDGWWRLSVAQRGGTEPVRPWIHLSTYLYFLSECKWKHRIIFRSNCTH